MSNFIMKYLKSSFLSSIGLTILGFLLFFQAEITIVSISYVIGGILVAIGTLALIRYINQLHKNVKNELDIIYGLGTIILGIVVISNPKAIASIIPFVLGIIMIISSSAKLQIGLQMRKDNNHTWVFTTITSLLTLMCGILLIFNPFAGAKFITKVIGILLLIYGIIDMISSILIKKAGKSQENKTKEAVIKEAEIIEDNTKDIKQLKNIKNNKKEKGKDE